MARKRSHSRDFTTLVDIVARLRATDGCPWDRAQSHTSLRRYLLEESYEALEALDAADMPRLKEELGDVLLQVLLHSQIAAEEGHFAVWDVVQGLAEKLVHRHPHVFGDAQASTPQEVEARWEGLKQQEKEVESSLLDRVPPTLPALAYSYVIQQRAAGAGFDWPDLHGVLDKVAEEAKELEQASDRDEREREFGDLLFSLVNLGRRLDINGEDALRRANRTFQRRFAAMEDLCRQRGVRFQELHLEEQDALWEEVKSKEPA